MATILEQELEKKVTIVENGRHRKYPKSVLAIRQLVNKAVSGDLRAVRQLLDLEFRLNPEGVRQPTFVEIFRRLAAEVDEAKTSNDDLP